MRLHVYASIIVLSMTLVPVANAGTQQDQAQEWCPILTLTFGGVPPCMVRVNHEIMFDLADCAIDGDTGDYHGCYFRIQCDAWGAGSNAIDPVTVILDCNGSDVNACMGLGGCAVDEDAFGYIWTTNCWTVQARATVVLPWSTQSASTQSVQMCVNPSTGPYVV